MTKADERAEVVKAEADAEKVYQAGRSRQDVVAVDPQAQFPPLFGNENYVSDHQPRAKRDTKHTQEEWLVEAGEVVAVMERGDAVSHETVKMLFLDAYDVIEGFTPPATRSKKNSEKDEDEDEAKRRRQEK